MNNTNIYYHVISRGNKGNDIILDDQDFETYLNKLSEIKIKEPFDLFHFSLLNNHVHLIIGVDSPEKMAKIMKFINNQYSRYFNQKHSLKDHVWRNRPRRFVIDNPSYLLTVGIYVELNPIRAGLTDEPQNYRWSSASSYLGGNVHPLITLDPEFLSLGDTHNARVSAYRKLVTMWRNKPVEKKTAARFFEKSPSKMHPAQ